MGKSCFGWHILVGTLRVLRGSDSPLDEAIAYCHETLDSFPSPRVVALNSHLGVLERALWGASTQPASVDQIVRLAKLLLKLRDEVRAASLFPPDAA